MVQQHHGLSHAAGHMPPNSISDVQSQFVNHIITKIKSGMARHRCGLRSWFDTASSLIGPTWRTWNGLAESWSVTCLQQHKFMPKFAEKCQTFCQSQPKIWHGWAQMGTQELV
jgi:hypothetical protein